MCRAVGGIGKATIFSLQQFFANIQKFMDCLSESATEWCHNKKLMPNVLLLFFIYLFF